MPPTMRVGDIEIRSPIPDFTPGQAPQPWVRKTKHKRTPEPVLELKDKKKKRCGWCRFRRIFLPWLEPHHSICVPPSAYRPDGLSGYSIDRGEWEMVQRNFAGPVGQYYAANDPDKPEVYMYFVPGASRGWAPLPQYQHPYNDSNPPPYDWAQPSELPVPVVVGDSWPSLFAAQREKSRLLETHAYLMARIAETDRKVRAVMDTE